MADARDARTITPISFGQKISWTLNGQESFSLRLQQLGCEMSPNRFFQSSTLHTHRTIRAVTRDEGFEEANDKPIPPDAPGKRHPNWRPLFSIPQSFAATHPPIED